MRIESLAFLAFLSGSQTGHAFLPPSMFARQQHLSHPSNLVLFAEEIDASSANDELQQLRKELEEAQAFRKQMLEEIEAMEGKVSRINGESKQNIGRSDSGRRDLSPLSSSDEIAKRKTQAEEARKKAEEEARNEKLRKEAEEAARLLVEEKAMLKQAESERQALVEKMAKLKKEVETNKDDPFQFLIAKNAVDAALAGGFIGLIAFGRFLLEDRDEIKTEAAASQRMTQPVRSTFQIEDIAPKQTLKPAATSGKTTYLETDATPPPKSYSPFGGAKPQPVAGSDSLYAPPAAAAAAASTPAATPAPKPAPQKASARVAATAAVIIPPAPTQQSPAPVVEETKPVQSNDPPTQPKAAESSSSQQPSYAVGGASYMETLGGNNSGAPPVSTSYSPFGTKPKASSSGNSLYSPPVNGSSPPPAATTAAPEPASVAEPKQQETTLPPVTTFGSYTDLLGGGGGSSSSAAPTRSSYSPFGSNPKVAHRSDSLYAPPATSSPQESSVPPAPEYVAPPAQQQQHQQTSPPKKSYLPYGTKPKGKPWWDSAKR